MTVGGLERQHVVKALAMIFVGMRSTEFFPSAQLIDSEQLVSFSIKT